jgi:NADH-quinone oxidoreductase subunit H
MVWESLVTLSQLFLFPGFLFLFSLALFYQWVDRKAVARFQNRQGPLYTGPLGLLQPLADLFKLLSKEFVIPEKANSFIFRLAPITLLAYCLIGMFVIPIAGPRALTHFEGDIILIIILFTLISITVFFCGWGSTGVYSVVGGVRAAMQLLVFEIPLAIVIMGPAILAKSLSMSELVLWQHANASFAILQPIGFITFVICLLSELEVIPFDIPIAKGEIVAGWRTEFNGRGLALVILASDVELLLSASLVTTIYLGGPLPIWILPPIAGYIVKTTAIVFLFSTLKSLFARFRLDQVLSGSWKFLVPLAIIQIFLIELTK